MSKIYLLLHIAVILAGFTGIFGKLITLNEGLLVWYRVLFSAIILFIITRFSKVNRPTTFGNKIDMAKTGMLITIHWVFFYASIKYSNISIGVVCYCLTSFFTAIFKPMIEKKRVRISELLLSSLTLLGISLIFHFDTSYRLGITLGIISSAFAALYTIFNERLVRHHNTKTINYYQMMGGTVGLGLLLPAYLHFFPAETIIPDIRNSLYLILLSLFCTVGLYILVSEILKKIPAFTVNLTFNLEPIYSIIIAFLFFGESKEVNVSFYIGLILIITPVVLQSFITARQSLRIKG